MISKIPLLHWTQWVTRLYVMLHNCRITIVTWVQKTFASNKCRSSDNSKRLKPLLFQSCIHWECRRFKNSYPSSQTAVAVSPNSTPVYTNCPLWISPAEPQSFPLQPKNRNNLTWQYCISRIFIVMRRQDKLSSSCGAVVLDNTFIHLTMDKFNWASRLSQMR